MALTGTLEGKYIIQREKKQGSFSTAIFFYVTLNVSTRFSLTPKITSDVVYSGDKDGTTESSPSPAALMEKTQAEVQMIKSNRDV